MENASKALIMAGGVLLGVMIVGLVVFTFNQMRSIAKQEDIETAIHQQKNFNAQWEKFNGNIYGTDIITIANNIHDYNLTESENKGYTAVTTTIDLGDIKLELDKDIHSKMAKDIIKEVCEDWNVDAKPGLSGKLTKNAEQQVYAYIQAMEQVIAELGGTVLDTNPSRTVSYLAGLSETKLQNHGVDEDGRKILMDYTEIVQKLRLFKNQKFKAELVYDEQNGRVNEIHISKR